MFDAPPLALTSQIGYAPYAGIGSRETPEEVCHYMSEFAKHADSLGYTVRSGGAAGADEAFEVVDAKEIYLPYKGFNKKEGILPGDFDIAKAEEIASRYHPAWPYLKPYQKAFHTRNSCQMFGRNLVAPSIFVICWTKNGKVDGGTGQALRIAIDNNIPIYNLAIEEDLNNILEILK